MKNNVFLILFVLVLFSYCKAYPKERRDIFLSLEDVLFYAKKNDIELKSLSFSLNELTRSKKNLYRRLFPSISTSFSRTSVVNIDEADSRNYDFSVTLKQILYDQLSYPIQFKNFNISLEEAKLKIKIKEKDIEKKAVDLYLNILLGEERLKNKKEEYRLYKKLLELIREEQMVGMKTMLDVIDTERKLLEVELELEDLSGDNKIQYRDLVNLIGIKEKATQIVLECDMNYILSSLLGINGSRSFEDIYDQMIKMGEEIIERERLYSIALNNNFEIKKMKLALIQNRLKQKLLSIQFLQNISLNYELLFTGERFFPANTTHKIAMNILLDFGILSSDVSLSETSKESLISRSSSAKSDLLKSLNPMDAGKYLRIESYTTGEKIEKAEKDILKSLDVWIIKANSLIKAYRIKLKQRDIFHKNNELFQIKLQIGEVKKVDWLNFLIQENEFMIELEKVKYDFINLIWEIEDILNSRIIEIA